MTSDLKPVRWLRDWATRWLLWLCLGSTRRAILRCLADGHARSVDDLVRDIGARWDSIESELPWLVSGGEVREVMIARWGKRVTTWGITPGGRQAICWPRTVA